MVEKGFAQTDGFAVVGAFTVVNQRLVDFFNALNQQTEFLRTFDGITRIKLHTG